MSGHKVVGNLSKPLTLLLLILAAEGMYVAIPRIPLLFSRLEVSILTPLCTEIYPVYVTLDDRPLTNLEETNFEVTVDNRPVQFRLIKSRTINAMVLLDTSGSMTTPSKIEAGKEMTRFVADTALRSGGKVALITFNDKIGVECDWTDNADIVNRAINDLQASGSTRLWDSIKESTSYLQVMHSSKPCQLSLLVVISDFMDTGSQTSQEQALTELEKTETLAVTIVYGSVFDASLTSAEALAKATHGRSLRANDAKEAISQLERLLESIYYFEIKEKGHIKITTKYMERTGSDEIDS